MDRLSKLHALLGDGQAPIAGAGAAAATDGSIEQRPTQHYAQEPTQLATQLEFGELADAAESFCPWLIIKKYPYTYIGGANRDKVAKGFWDEGKLFNETWDFFYIHRLQSDTNTNPIILVPTEQLEAFLAKINRAFHIRLEIPSGDWGRAFRITFENDGTPRPRYLGKSTNKEMAENLHSAVPPRWFKHKGEGDTAPTPSDRSIAAFQAKMDLVAQATKGKKIANAEKKKVERIAKQQSWNHATKRVQRYLGIRQASNEKQGGPASSVDPWGENNIALKASVPRSANFNPDKPAPYDQEGDVVFVCVDIEANERNSNQITEIGIATLDTRDIKSVIPGERGVNWMSKIRARHFRIEEYKHIVNKEFVSGCPGRFEFGESEFVKLKGAPQAVANCFKHPFSNIEDSSVLDPNEPKRNIIFVGHSAGADITYLKTLGYDIHNLSNIQEIIDTALMWQGIKREHSPRNLGSILAEIDIAGWNLHNAGNDAVYTLQAMIGIAIKQLYEREKREEIREEEKKARVEESIIEATQLALEREEGWSSEGENSDGGAPIAPVPPGSKTPVVHQTQRGSPHREGPWRAPAQSRGMNSQSQGNKRSWQYASSSGNGQAASSGNGYGSATSYSSWRQVEQTAAHGPTLPGSNPTHRHGYTSTSRQGGAPTTLPGSFATPLPASIGPDGWPTYDAAIKNANEAQQ